MLLSSDDYSFLREEEKNKINRIISQIYILRVLRRENFQAQG